MCVLTIEELMKILTEEKKFIEELKNTDVIESKTLKKLIDHDVLNRISRKHTELGHFSIKKTGKYEFDVTLSNKYFIFS